MKLFVGRIELRGGGYSLPWSLTAPDFAAAGIRFGELADTYDVFRVTFGERPATDADFFKQDMTRETFLEHPELIWLPEWDVAPR